MTFLRSNGVLMATTKNDKRPIPGYANEHRVKHGFDAAATTLIKQGFFSSVSVNNAQLDRIEGLLMALKADFETLRLAMNDATNKIAARIEDLMSKITAGGMTAAEEDEVKAGLQAEVGRLKALGVNPEEPVPPTT